MRLSAATDLRSALASSIRDANHPNGTAHTNTNIISVRRLNCSERRRGVGVVGAVMVTSGILKSTLDSTAPPPILVEWRHRACIVA
jgi:hypothetical protein